MDEIYAACITYEPSLVDFVDFRKSNEPVWLLGKKYNSANDGELEALKKDIRSKLWFTYRKQFPPIGSTGITSDTGWGCMHRCGQMVLGQALIYRHLGRDWIWESDSENYIYWRIRKKFSDKQSSKYSIHNIAIQGDTHSKMIGEWFGPNTIAQVLKRLVRDDAENDVTIHVAMDNMVIKSEIRRLCKESSVCYLLPNQQPCAKSKNVLKNIDQEQGFNLDGTSVVIEEREKHNRWCPLLLIIPLRLGLSDIMPVYFEKLKTTFTLKQSVGIIGGRTNHASYFIGYVGNELVYLDPHTTQMFYAEETSDDESYHCPHAGRMNFNQLDPSIALCFYIENSDDFEAWCINAQSILLQPQKDAFFEILEEKPPMLPYVDIEDPDDTCGLSLPSDEGDRKFTSDDEFELLL